MSNTMLQFKRQDETAEPQPRWNIGVDNRHVALYIGVALIAGLVGGYFAGRSTVHKEEAPKAFNRPPVSQPIPENPQIEYHKVSHIARADTIEVEGVGAVRLIGIETPDGKSPEQIYAVHGQRALSFVEKALLGQDVRLEYDESSAGDDSGLRGAYVYTRDGRLINAEMVRQGLALVRSAEQFRMASDFRTYERDAMQAMRGLWGSSAEPSSGALQVSTTSKSSPTENKSRKLEPLPPSAIGQNIPALSGSSSASIEPTVWVSTADKMYHKSTCDFLNKKKHALSQSEAKSQGYTACSRCYASTVMKAP